MRKIIVPLLVGLAILSGNAAFAEPVVNISPRLHPNLAEAQRLSRKAFEKIGAAQQANQMDMEGHAQRAKELLEQVNIELKLAAESVNRNRRR